MKALSVIQDLTNGTFQRINNDYNIWDGFKGFNNSYMGVNDSTVMYHIMEIPLSNIDVTDRLLNLNEENVENLLASIRQHGLLSPIAVQWTEGKGSPTNRQHRLIYGAHRLEASRRYFMELAKELADHRGGRPADEVFNDYTIPCLVFSPRATEKQIKAIEAAENLVRQILTKEQAERLTKCLIKSAPIKKVKEVFTKKGIEGLKQAADAATKRKSEEGQFRGDQKSPLKSDKKKPRGLSTQPNVLAELVRPDVEKQHPDLSDAEKEKKVSDTARDLRSNIRDAASDLGIELPKDNTGRIVYTPETVLDVVAATQRIAEDEKYAEEVAQRADERKKVSNGRKIASGAAKRVKEIAQETGREDLAEKIDQAVKRDEKGVVVNEVADELGVSARGRCEVQLYWPAEKIGERLVSAFDRATVFAVAQWIIKWCKENPVK